MVHQFSYRRRKNVNEIKSQVIRMFVFPNNGGALSIIGVIMKAPDDSWIRSAPLVTELPQYWVFIIFIWMLDCFSNSDGDQSVLTRHDHCRLHGVFDFHLHCNTLKHLRIIFGFPLISYSKWTNRETLIEMQLHIKYLYNVEYGFGTTYAPSYFSFFNCYIHSLSKYAVILRDIYW